MVTVKVIEVLRPPLHEVQIVMNEEDARLLHRSLAYSPPPIGSDTWLASNLLHSLSMGLRSAVVQMGG